MSRHRFLISFVVVALTLLWVVPVIADNPDPSTCLPACYAYNKAPAGGNGTEKSPWMTTDLTGLRAAVQNAVKGNEDFGTLEVITCNDAATPQCTAILYTYTRAGTETSSDLGAVPVPVVGVSLPFPYFLGSGVLLGVLLLGLGIILGRRAKRVNS